MGEKREARARRKKEEAAHHVGGWTQANASIYDQLASLPQLGPPLFPKDWSAGEITRGDAKRLRRAYHKAASRLHPDKVRELPDAAKALAEELFKALSDAYHKEIHRIEGRIAAQNV